jgi:hypothetical protein
VTGTTLAGHGLSVLLPRGWEGRLYRRTLRADGPDPAAYGHPGESMNPVLHLATFPLPPGRGDFGTGAVEVMGDTDAFVALLEYDQVEAARPLFAGTGMPRLTQRDFAGNALQRRMPGQLGCQRFFTAHGRPFCAYAVLGSRRAAGSRIPQINTVLATVTVLPR